VTVRILHISDTHLGKRQYRSDERLQDYADGFREAVEKAISLDVDAVIHTGDLFDAPNPNVPVVNECLDIISLLDSVGIPFYGIVGNHERKRDQQWLDLVDRFDLVNRLDRTPTYIGTGEDQFAVYGIDAVRSPEWETSDFTLPEPDKEAFVLLCMHELVNPPVPGHMAHYETEEILNRTGIQVDGLALGDYHEDESANVNGTSVWYPGSTEKTARDESEAHSVLELIYENGTLSKTKHTLEQPREFIEVTIEFNEGDGLKSAKKEIEKYNFTGENGKKAVGIALLEGEETGVTPRDVHGLLDNNGAAVTKVIDNRGLINTEDIDAESVDMSEMEDLLDKEVEQIELNDTSQELEQLIRNEEIKKTNIRKKGAEILNESINGSGK